MKLTKIFAIVLVAACMSLAAFADSAVFQNTDGTWTASAGHDLTLGGSAPTLGSFSQPPDSALTGISGLGSIDCLGAGCSGNVTLTTGAGNMQAGGSLGANAVFSAGGVPGATALFGSFTITGYAGGAGGAFTFTGMFSHATWTETIIPASGGNPQTEYWTFVGTIMNGTLKDSEGTFTNINGAHIDLTTVAAPVPVGGFNTWTDAGGQTTFPSPVPEPGTLTLLGSGLVGIGVFARRRLSRKQTASE